MRKTHTDNTRLARWRRRLANSRHGLWWIGLASFAETLIVPIPIELVLIPYMLANPGRIWRIAAATTAGCVLGALVGYGVGIVLFDSVGRWLIETFGWAGAYDMFQARFAAHGFWAIVGIGLTPIPFQIGMLAAGAAEYSVVLFIAAAAVARGLRYFGLGLLVRLFGARALALWQRHATATGLVLLVAAALGALLWWWITAR